MATTTTEAIHHGATSAVHAVAEHGVHLTTGTVSAVNEAATTATSLSATAAGSTAWGAVFTSTGIALASIASTIINVVKYKNLRADVRDIYKEEIATKLGKSPEQVTSQDLDIAAKGDPERGISGNAVLAEELERLKKERNFGIGVTVASIMLAIPLAIMATTFLGGTGMFGAAIAAAANPTWSLATVAGIATKLAVGFGVHKLVEYPMEAVGLKLMGEPERSTHELIEGLIKDREAGKTLSKEQILGVFVSANKSFCDFVKKEMGKEYGDLDLESKKLLTQSFEQYIPLEHITKNINDGRVKISELAFSVVGQRSGVAPSPEPRAAQLNVVGKARGLMHNLGQKIGLNRNSSTAQQQYTQPVAPQPSMARAPRKIVEYDNPNAGRPDGRTWASVVRPPEPAIQRQI